MRAMRRSTLLALLALAGAAGDAPASGQQPSPAAVSGEIRTRTERLRAAGTLRLLGATVPRSEALLGAYTATGHLPLWSSAEALTSLLSALAAVEADGLTPAHYHLEALRRAAAAPHRTPAEAAELDLLASAALLAVAHDLRFGRAEPLGPTGTRPASPFGGADPAADLLRVAQGGRVREAVLALRPAHFIYRGLLDALAALRAAERAGGWEALPPGRALRLDSADARVPLLRARLALSGDLATGAGAPAAGDLRFDAELERAVKAFQHRHGLNEDGVVGPATLAALNVPVGVRIEQLRVNLERARWITHDLPATFVAVNAAGARAYVMREGQVVFETRVVVGKEHTRTPVFSAPMRYVELNPTWTVPPGIVGEVLARIRREPGYLAAEGMRVLDGSGRALDPARIDFSRYTARSFPYTFRQDAGPKNPLGQVKLMFPNPHNVYLHDTPSKSLFEREERLFSHGCIRVEDPLRLAELVLDDPRWSREALEAAIATGATRQIPLARPLPVLVLYWTAAADLHGELHFYKDVYGRDAAVLAALDRP